VGLRRQSHTPSDSLDISWSMILAWRLILSHTVADRKFKACFPRCPLVALTRDALMRNLSRGRQPPGCPRIGKTQGIFVRAPRERAPGARRSAAPHSAPGAGHPPQDGGESGSEDVPQGEGLGTGGCGKLGGIAASFRPPVSGMVGLLSCGGFHEAPPRMEAAASASTWHPRTISASSVSSAKS